jgi:hypothetical protein
MKECGFFLSGEGKGDFKWSACTHSTERIESAHA